MKRLILLLITIAIIGLTGCSADIKEAINNGRDVIAKQTETTTEKNEESTTECKEKTTEKAKIEPSTKKTTEATTEVNTEATTQKATEEPRNDSTEITTEAVTEECTEATEEPKTEAPKEDCTEAPKEPETEEPTEEPTEATTEAPAPTEISYSPGNVVSLATAKCQAGGMITTTDNLANLLAKGKITEDEYNEYYPYDGLGYYSVFVETDLNKAATTSGRLLGSEDAIATYIADMLLLESEPYFFIEYGGTTSLGGQDFYEFRCYR